MKTTLDARFTSRQIPDVSVRYRKVGAGKKLLFLHGTWVDPFIFTELFTTLSKEYELLIPDIPPFGRSRLDSMLTLEQYAVLFDEMLESLGWDSVVVVGHSFGGGIALHLAAVSAKIRRVVVCNSIGLPFRRPEILGKYPKMVYRALRNLSKEHDSTILRKLLLDVGRVLLHNPIPPIVQTITQCLCEEKIILQKISAPVYIIWGKQDEILPLSYIEKIQSLVPRVHVNYITGHHNWCLVDQKRAGDLIRASLDSER